MLDWKLILIEEGNITEDEVPGAGETGIKPPTGKDIFIDGKVYDASKPNDYIKSFKIKSK